MKPISDWTDVELSDAGTRVVVDREAQEALAAEVLRLREENERLLTVARHESALRRQAEAQAGHHVYLEAQRRMIEAEALLDSEETHHQLTLDRAYRAEAELKELRKKLNDVSP